MRHVNKKRNSRMRLAEVLSLTLLLTLATQGCSAFGTQENKKAAESNSQPANPASTSKGPDIQSLYDNSKGSFPLTMNSKVESWIDYLSGRSDELENTLKRMPQIGDLVRPILKKQGVPEDLIYLAAVESGLDPSAKSGPRAGLWQFTDLVAKKYGLVVNQRVDERLDPIKSSTAAAKYLKDLFLMFESWYLATCAFRIGEYRILHAIEKLKTNNFWRIAETVLIPQEGKELVPKVIAAAIISKDPERFGLGEKRAPTNSVPASARPQ